MSSDAALGVFDSGLGGLTVVRALQQVLPSEQIVYLGDTARVPYGTRSAETVIRYARGCARVLIGRGVKALVIACNTASAVAVEMLRAELDLPVVGVIEPGARAALLAADSFQDRAPVRIGVLGTAGTIASGAYPRAVRQFSTRHEVSQRSAPLLVPLVEEGWLTGEVPRLAVERYVAPLIEEGARVLVLGCTHYPLLKDLIEQVASECAGEAVRVVDSAEVTARDVAELIAAGKVRPSSRTDKAGMELFVTDLPASFEQVARRFLGDELPPVKQLDLSG